MVTVELVTWSAIARRFVIIVSFKQWISDTGSGPIMIAMESEIALIIASIAHAVL